MGAFATSNPTGGSDITGSGTTNQVAVFASPRTIGVPTRSFTASATGFTIGSTTEYASSLLAMDSTTQGFLPPRMTTVQRDLIASPVAGLMVYDSTLETFAVRTSASGVPQWAGVITTKTIPLAFAVGDLLYASTTTALSKLADVAVGSVLVSGGVGVAPAWSSSPTFTTDITTPTVILSGNISAASWTTSGVRLKGVAGNLTNTTSSGTVGNTYTNALGGNTIISSTATIYTNYYGLFLNPEIAGSGSVITNNFSLGVNGQSIFFGTVRTSGVGMVINSDLATVAAGDRNFVFIPSTTETLNINRRASATACLSLGSDASSNATLNTANADYIFSISSTEKLRLSATNLLTFADTVNLAFNTATGTKLGTATSQKLGFWNATPIVQPTTAVAASTFVANTSLIANDTATFDGYTIGQVVKALRNMGALA